MLVTLVEPIGVLLLSVFGLIAVTFGMLHLIPGDPGRLILGIDASKSSVAHLDAEMGLHKPLASQFVTYVGHVVTGNLGHSFVMGESVSSEIVQKLPYTIELTLVSLAVIVIVGIPGGIFLAAMTRGGRRHRLEVFSSGLSGFLGAIPSFVSALILSAIFAVHFEWLPVAGATKVQSVVLPALAVAVAPTALLLRITRLEALSVLSQDYIRSARAKRLPTWRIYLLHVLPNTLMPVLTVVGLLFALLMGGVVVVENVFAWPGLGTLLTNAFQSLDYQTVQGTILILGLIVVGINTLTDLVIRLVDPRLRRGTT